MIFLSGLPRTGSTLLTSILSQNPDIHAEGNSALCQLMWDTKVSCETNALEQLLANNRFNTKKDIISALPGIYYSNTTKPIVIDKCRSWTLPANLQLIKEFITDKPKIIVMVRPLKEIVKSYVYINQMNNINVDVNDLLSENSEPIMRSLYGVNFALKQDSNEFIFIKYKNLIEKPKETIKEIYDFCEIDPYDHQFTDIVNIHPENDSIYNMLGLHDVRPKIKYRKIDIKLSKEVEKRIDDLELDYGNIA